MQLLPKSVQLRTFLYSSTLKDSKPDTSTMRHSRLRPCARLARSFLSPSSPAHAHHLFTAPKRLPTCLARVLASSHHLKYLVKWPYRCRQGRNAACIYNQDARWRPRLEASPGVDNSCCPYQG